MRTTDNSRTPVPQLENFSTSKTDFYWLELNSTKKSKQHKKMAYYFVEDQTAPDLPTSLRYSHRLPFNPIL